ncbi:MAG: divalent metal cation transporter [Hyphomonadaceae bacterium]|nr:divalent metal cation transporter [Hyphomonadaceae bacterium]
MSQKNVLKALGPGLLFAGAAIGVSHLVQSTRAGAEYGLALLVAVLAANLVKYPAFLIGNRYSAAAGENLLAAYRRQGHFATASFVLATLLTMFAACASISLTTAALLKSNLGITTDTSILVLVIWGFVGLILYIGQYRALDTLIKILLSFLTIATLIATIAILPKVTWSGPGSLILDHFDKATLLFIVALVGWMPAPLDTSVWQSLWSQARTKDTQHTPTQGEATFDFNVGFFATTFLAVCFVFMGAGIMYSSGAVFEAGAVGFANQIVELYEVALGTTISKLVGFAALAVIFSTTLTAIDAWPRTLAVVVLDYTGKSSPAETPNISRHPYYWLSMLVLLIGAYLIITAMMASFTSLIDIATTVSFLMAPVFAFLNHKAMFAGIVPAEQRPGRVIYVWSLSGCWIMGAIALFYLWFRFFG